MRMKKTALLALVTSGLLAASAYADFDDKNLCVGCVHGRYE